MVNEKENKQFIGGNFYYAAIRLEPPLFDKLATPRIGEKGRAGPHFFYEFTPA